MATLQSFPQFASLPVELQFCIIGFAVEACLPDRKRVITIRISNERLAPIIPRLHAIFHTNRQFRSEAIRLLSAPTDHENRLIRLFSETYLQALPTKWHFASPLVVFNQAKDSLEFDVRSLNKILSRCEIKVWLSRLSSEMRDCAQSTNFLTLYYDEP
ncbi:hypothetical protein BU26DRAFT_568773 [Trematosphaeria pertusa]|uniref:2EXR domain-containing protein n=1 Tax=Trematosphaeria pertusa TaxID=390896 RepID=A0A6A6I5D6_9PLEO|nr:uncharacterized protein BU26DRAFT_568773 [Trematosphaeria pertusa]KAF2244773.1 hypothetical protein BU26DRAFT_568773 [Trematosphaeria pertusa]